MTRRTFAVAALVAALGTIPMIAQGQGPGGGFGPGPQGRGRGPGGPGPGGPGGPNLLAMVNELDLSDAQRQQLRQIMEEARRAGGPGAGVREAEKKLHEAFLAETPDSAAIDALKAALNTAHAAELDHRVAMMLKVAQILTPAQREQLLKLRLQGPPRVH